ncbi:MAG: outer membrane protein assembly factor BamA [Gammaproteobacteria bacterium HGW-Gammaproteobacteria-14]|nr:MAG: outer membrane protein assembly factor BamA [Gammaproteobacteria bacterium HGW-Gammaproteobacteria-14]
MNAGGSLLRLILIFFALLLVPISAVYAEEPSFRVQDIRVEGLQRLPVERVFRSLPVQSGDQLDSRRIAEAVRALYAAGDFEDVQIGREGDVLVVMVQERPSIAKIDISGNKLIDTDSLRKGLQSAKLIEGEVFRRSTLEAITGELERQYVSQGLYGATIETETVPLPRNRVELSIKIYEGKAARIQDVNVVGNTAFTNEELVDTFQLRSRHFWSFIKGDDKYSRERLAGDLERLRSWYLDRGYINISIESTQVTLTQDRRHVYITVNIAEGDLYTVNEVKLAGDLAVEEDQLSPLLVVSKGQVFSQQLLTYTSDLLTRRLGNEGYTFADVNAFTEVNEDDKTVDVTFFVDPGRKAYVRRINFTGNSKTHDEVLRREMRQFEAAPANSALIDLSRQRLQRLGFFSVVEAETPKIPGVDDLVDVNYRVEEQPSGSIGANIGYSDGSGFIFGANVSQNNFMGTGNRVSFALSRSEIRDSYSFSHQNPYYTLDGVSRGFNLYYSKIDFSETTVASYAANRRGGGVSYGYPISEYARLNFGYGVDRIDIETGAFVATEIAQFLANEGTNSFDSLKLNASWQMSTLNRGVLPDRGWSQTLSLDVAAPGSDYYFYKMNWSGQRYVPLSNRWVLRARADIGYGDGYGDDLILPFYEHFFAGGIGSVRGYRARSLGPRSPSQVFVNSGDIDPSPDPIGGNMLTEGSLELIFPAPFAANSRSLRTFLFADVGNVWQTEIQGSRFDLDPSELRYAAGVGLTWLTAIGPLGFSLAKPIKNQRGDDTEVFQFSLGQVF